MQEAISSSFQVCISFREELRAAKQERGLSFTISGGGASWAACAFAPFSTFIVMLSIGTYCVPGVSESHIKLIFYQGVDGALYRDITVDELHTGNVPKLC